MKIVLERVSFVQLMYMEYKEFRDPHRILAI